MQPYFSFQGSAFKKHDQGGEKKIAEETEEDGRGRCRQESKKGEKRQKEEKETFQLQRCGGKG
jgi:hypothetical protein